LRQAARVKRGPLRFHTCVEVWPNCSGGVEVTDRPEFSSMLRACFALLISLWLTPFAAAQTQQEGEMSLYIQQLEAQVRQLTGQNERLLYELNKMRVAAGQPPLQAAALADPSLIDPAQTGAVAPAQPGAPAVEMGANVPAGAGAPQDLGTLSVAPNDPLISPDGATDSTAPVDLSTLAGGVAGELVAPAPVTGVAPAPAQTGNQEVAGLPQAPPPTTALSGSPRDEYDLAYGYILTGDYDLAEQTFTSWLAAFPNDPQAPDAQFWLGESHLQQGEYRDAANSFLAVYKTAPEGNKGPDALLKLGVSLSALGEKTAACGTLAELGRRYPNAAESLMSRVHDEEKRAGC
jgi:tol-pal system protein YbgF